MKYYLAVDVGASSGRHILGWNENGELRTEEIYRFPNGVREKDGHLTWDLDALVFHVKEGVKKAKEKTERIESLSVDTWGVDYVLMDGEKEIPPAFAYRDRRTGKAVEEVHRLLPFSRLYEKTGIQFQPFNTVYQLYADKISGRLERATDFLMMPEYLLYRLTGKKAHEYTNATTGGMVSASLGEYDPAILSALGFPPRLFPKLDRPGKTIGEYDGIRAVLCATHDTASAVEGIPVNDRAPYISSGTWSLFGVKTEKALTGKESESANWSNEGGVGYFRYQKNIMGLWPVNRLREELCPGKDFKEIEKEAEASRFDETVPINDPRFLSPESMKGSFDSLLSSKPETPGDYFRCAYRSLALSYREALEELERHTGKTYQSLTVVGGGAKNRFLNRLTEEMTGRRVNALPVEATALGNLKIQMEADR